MGEDEVERALRVVRGARVMVMVWRDRDSGTTKPMGNGRPNECGDDGKQGAKERRARLHEGHARLQRGQGKNAFSVFRIIRWTSPKAQTMSPDAVQRQTELPLCPGLGWLG
jgi:hypothetical protein